MLIPENIDCQILIPARYGSTRFPGKPLAKIGGVAMIQRVWNIAVAAVGKNRVAVAVDDPRIEEFVQSFGARAITTPPQYRSGTERILRALEQAGPCHPDLIVVNLQGDAVLTPPWVIQDTVNALCVDRSASISTPAVRLDWESYEALELMKSKGEVGGTLVVTDINGRALYFSKSMIPNAQRNRSTVCPALRHIGLYVYRYQLLQRLNSIAPTPLETLEGLEQLRALESGIPVQVVVVDYRGRSHGSVDSPDDVARIERIIQREGELL